MSQCNTASCRLPSASRTTGMLWVGAMLYRGRNASPASGPRSNRNCSASTVIGLRRLNLPHMSLILPDLWRVHYFPTADSPARLSGMDSRDLSKEQAELLLAQIWPMLGYLGRLKARMERRRFPQNDKLYSRVVAAH